MAGRRKKRRHLAWGRRTAKPGIAPGTLTVDPEAPKPVVRVMAFDETKLEERELGDPSELEAIVGKWPVTWVNVDGLGDADVLERIGAIFGMHRLALEDVVNVDQRPKVEEYAENLFIIGRMIHAEDELKTEQVSFYLGSNFLVTFQERRGDDFDAVRERIRTARKRIRSSGPDYLAYALLDALIDGYFPVIEHFGEKLEALEVDVYAQPTRQTLARIQDAKRSLLMIRRAVWPHRDALRTMLNEELEPISSGTVVYLRDCLDHAMQIVELLEVHRETASDLVGLYMSEISNRMNEIMKVLTIIATIFIPLGFIAGVYGMNFDPEASPWNMPELSWPFGYPLVLGMMAIVAAGLLVFFRRKGWLGGRVR